MSVAPQGAERPKRSKYRTPKASQLSVAEQQRIATEALYSQALALADARARALRRWVTCGIMAMLAITCSLVAAAWWVWLVVPAFPLSLYAVEGWQKGRACLREADRIVDDMRRREGDG